MATNDFLPFAGGAGANVLTQAEWAALAEVATGFTSGILPSANLNKAIRQATIIAAMLAQFIADNSGQNAVDDGTTATLEANLKTAIQTLALPTPTVAAGQVGIGTTTSTTVGAAGTAAALPAAPVGYLEINVGGTAYLIPYYTV